MKIFAGCITDKGNYSQKNQDRAVCHVRRSKKDILAVACVCDGIGSLAQSEVAAEIMTEGITRWFHGVENYFPGRMMEDAITEDLELTIRELNELVCAYHTRSGINIGCTMSVFLLINRNYYVFHVGDSRIYCVRNAFYQITRDEVSVVESQGKVKTRLSNYIGKTTELWMNQFSGTVEEKDIYLMGSDGLFKKLVYEDVCALADSIKSNRRAQKVSESLLKLVLEKGERDNVSCILLRIASLK